MTSKKTILLVSLAIGLGFQLCGIALQAQSGETYKARLAPVPALTPLTVPGVAGIGSASATLAGRKLTVNGTFDKMASPATVAHLSMGQLTGVRGTSVFDLTVSKTGTGTSGTISGTFDLTPEQVDALKKGRLYVQLHSEGAPNGHLMGWLLK
jgi:hypothetical protein